uniref:Uncharacterized protein n=1 Tax=Solanum tuberosum TaxID=4113 RepID=M1CET3_SOLTU
MVLSSEKSRILEAQSVVKPNEGPFTEETNIGSMGVSSTISERAFEGDLPEGKSPESCTPTAGAELVAVQSLASLRGDAQPTSLEHELESPNQFPPRSEPIFDQTPKSFDVGSPRSEPIFDQTPKSVDVGSDKEEEEEQRSNGEKGRESWNCLTLKGDKRKYITRSEEQKVMGSAIAASKAHTERTRKRRREGLKPEHPASTPLSIVNSESESEDAVKYVVKRRREAEEERIKIKRGNQKRGERKSTAKNAKVKKQTSLAKGEKGRKQSEEQPVKRPGPKIKDQIEEKDLTRKERVENMEQQKVLNGRVFDPDIHTLFGMANLVDAVTIQGWNHLFEPPVPYLHEPEVREFFYKMELLEGGGIITIVRNVEIHLDEETLGIILGVPVVGVRTIEGCKPSGDFSKLATKRGDVKLGRGVPGTTKQMFTMSTLLECECIEGPAKGRSQVADVLEQQATFRKEVTDLTKILSDKEVEITRLKSELQKAVSRVPGTSESHELMLKELRDENTMLLKTNASLNEDIKSLNKQLIQAHESANERMLLLMHTFNPSLPPS